MRPSFTIADHSVLSLIGTGAYGEVWLARNVIGVARAVKVVRRNQFEGSKSYEREFSGLKKFEPISRAHEGLVDVLQVGRDDEGGFFYYLMELADDANAVAGDSGGLLSEKYQPLTLQELIRRQTRIPVLECVRIGAQVAGALEFLHTKGLVHRDIKPSNIVYVGGMPKLADVGLVASLGDAKSFVGTEGFIAPEGPGTATSDLYSLGKVLYEMVTGESRMDYPEIPGDLQVGADGGAFSELNEVILRACAANPKDRHASAAELRGELLLLEAGRSVRKLRRDERLVRTWRRVGVAAMLVLFGVLGALRFERQLTETARRTAQSESALRRAIEEREHTARQNLYAADMNLTQQALDAGNYGRAEALLSAYLGDLGLSDVRGIEWFCYWQRLRGESIAVFRGHQEVISSLVMSRDGRRLFSASFDSTIREWSLADHKELRRWLRPGCLFMSLSMDPAGLKLAGEGGNRPYSCLLNLETGLWVTNISSASPSIAFSPMGNELVRGGHTMLFDTNGVVEVTDFEFKVRRVLPDSGGRAVFAPNGKVLATGAWAGAIRLWSWPTLELLGTLPGAGTVLSMCFSPDGGRLASVSREGRLVVWDMSSKEIVAETTAHSGSVIWSVDFSPDGVRLATSGNDQTVRIWEASKLAQEHAFRGHVGEVWAVRWTLDGRQLLSAGKDATIRMWSATRPSRFPEVSEVVQAAVFSADESLIAIRRRDGTGTVREASNDREVLSFEGIGEVGGFSSDGATLTILTAGWVFERRSLADGGKILERRAAVPPVEPFNRRLLSPDGKWLLVGLRNGDILVQNLSLAEAPFRLSGHQDMVVSLAISPDGRHLLSGSIDRTARLWELENKVLVKTISGHKMGVGSVAFSSNGSSIATGSWDDTIQVWDMGNQTRNALLGGHRGGVQAVCFAPDGRTLAGLTGESVLTFWSLASQREAGIIPLTPGTGQGWITVSPKGRWIAAVSQAGILSLVSAPRGELASSR